MDGQEERISRIEINVAKISADIDHLKDRIENGISGTITKIWGKINELPCAVHAEKFKGVEDKIEGQKTRINWLYWAFIIVVLGGVVLGIWMKNT